MTTSIMPSDAPPLKTIKARSADGMARRFLFGIMGKLKRGRITILEGPKRYAFGETSSAYPLEAVINVYHPRFYSKTLLGGSIGSAEAYMSGLWSADDLTTVFCAKIPAAAVAKISSPTMIWAMIFIDCF
jgi:cyclopropane-fatty-acyl-phospholipid synthase